MKSKKYYELYKSVKENILCGNYPPCHKLPSKRVMADMFGCSIITVENAYGMLYEEGYIDCKERSGYWVKKLDGFYSDNKQNSKAIELLQQEKAVLGRSFEYSTWVKTIRKVVGEKGELLFEKSPAFGIAELRNAISLYLLRYRGMFVQPKNVVIGSGAEQLYENALKLLGRDRTFGIEDPCYQGIKAVYQSEGVNIAQLKMGKDGILSDQLKKPFSVLHVTPFNSYPSNITATVGKRFEYLSWAKADQNRFIIEDDFASEFNTNPIDSLYKMGGDKVIYINTFSKSLSPSMRMGYMILPDLLLEKYNLLFGGFSCSVPVLEQYVLAEFITSGSFERHLNKARRKLNKQ